MPQPFNNAVITNAGAKLLTRAQAGEIKMEFTRIAIGSGNYTEDEKMIGALQKQIALKSLKNSYTLSGIDVYSDHSVKVTALITNQDPVTGQTLVGTGYYINEMGLYAKVKDGAASTEILYSIAVTAGENGDFMPPYNGYNPAQITQDYFATVSNSAEVTIVSSGAAALTEDLNLKADLSIIAPVEESPSSTEYTEGELLIFSGKLYKAIAAINKGDLLEIGINIIQTVLSKEIGQGGTRIVQIPAVTPGTYIYDGTQHSPAIEGFDPNTMQIQGETAVNAGDYNLIISLKNTQTSVWNDLTTTAKIFPYTIGKASRQLTLSKSTVRLNGDQTSEAVVVTFPGEGELSAISGDSTLVSVSLDGTATGSVGTIASVGLKNGTASITFSVPTTANYHAATGVIFVTCDFTRVFAFHYSENDSSPESVTYPPGYDNSGFTDPFSVNLTTGEPHYGDWNPDGENGGAVRWLFPRSCMLKYDGTVGYYLDENNETKKADGTVSDVADPSYSGNAMMEWAQDGKTIYWKIEPDADGKGFTFVVANGDTGDEDMKPWNHYNCDGEVAEHWYTPKYFGSSDGTRLRSISGGSNYVKNTVNAELALAKAANTGGKEIWNTEVYVDWLFFQLLCVLLCKSTNTQAKFGSGRSKSDNTSAIGQGTMNGRGMFFGSSDQTSGVKVFGMENPWGNIGRRIAGLVNANGTVKCKLCYGTADGTTVQTYNLDGSGYKACGSIEGQNGGYISHMNIGKSFLVPCTLGAGNTNAYYTDGVWYNNDQTNYAFVSGTWREFLHVGAFCCRLNRPVSDTGSDVGAALSCKPLAAGASKEEGNEN